MKEKAITACYMTLTENCNLRCVYCFERETRNIKKMMSEDTADKIVDFLFDQAVTYDVKDAVHITFFGGEPMLAPELMTHVLDYGMAKSKETGKPIRFSVITNGTIYNDKIEAFLQKWYDYTGTIDVQLSIDGIPEIQNEGRPCVDPNKKSSDLVEEAIVKFKDFLKRHKLPDEKVYIHPVISKATLPRLYESYMYLMQFCTDFQFAWVIEDDWDDNDLVILDKQLTKITEHLITRTTNPKKFPLKHFNKCSGCGAGRALICSDTDGNLFPCHRFYFYSLNIRSEMIFGNIHDEEPIDAKVREHFLNIDNDKVANAPCQICVAVNYENTGDLHKRPNDFDVKSMVIINHHFNMFETECEKKNLRNKVNYLGNKVEYLEKEMTKLRNTLFSIPGIKPYN